MEETNGSPSKMMKKDEEINGNDKHIIMVTGGTGLVGKGIQMALEKEKKINPNSHLNEEWVFLSSKDGDLRNAQETKKIFERVKPTHVIHLAARVGGLFANMKYKVEFFRENVMINDNVMECCKDFKVKKLVSCLSTCIYPDKVEYPLTEEKIHLGAPHTSNEGYAYAKRLVEVLSRLYSEEYGCNFTSVIPTNIYGCHDNFSIDGGHVIPGLIHKCYLAKQNNTNFTIWGSGKPLRQFIYNVDLAELMIWTLRSYNSSEPLILSVAEEDEISIGEVAHMIAESMEFKGEVIFDTTKSDGQFRKPASNKKLTGLHPEFKFTSLKEGLATTVKWFEENYSKARTQSHD